MSQSDFVSRGQALVAAGQFQEAVKVCRLGLLGRPTTVEGRVVLGQALLALKRFDEVLAEMRIALDLDQTAISAQVLRAEALLRKGDTQPAIEALQKTLQAAPGDSRILALLAEAERTEGRPTVTHPAVGFVGTGDTKHYPGRRGTDASARDGYTQPTSLQSPGSSRRSSQRGARTPDGDGPTELTPAPQMLAVGDKSGTVEVDPELEGVELPGDPDFADLAAPPVAATSARDGKSTKAAKPLIAAKPKSKAKTPTPALEDDDLEEVEETLAPERGKWSHAGPGPGTKVRNAVAMPSGVIGDLDPDRPPTLAPRFPRAATAGPNAQTRTHPISGPALATKPPTLPPPLPGMVPPASGLPSRGPLAAALPTMNAAQPPPPFVQQQAPYPPTPGSYAAAARPTLAISQDAPGTPSTLAAEQPTAAAIDALFSGPGPRAGWNQPANEPPIDPHLAALLDQHVPEPSAPPHQVAMGHVNPPTIDPMTLRTGMRRTRSRLSLVLWVLVSAGVIGGGVFAGFKIRAIRLEKQIVAARKRATDLAKADTWAGWSAARDGLSGIVQASSTVSNRAALARTRAQIAYEFGDGIPEALASVDALNGQGGLDGRIATTWQALARGNVKAARAASDAAVAGSDADPGAQFVAGEVALLAGDPKVAVAAMKIAAEKEPRPLYGIGLARAYAAAYSWDDALAAIDRVRAASTDHPAALIERAWLLAVSGRIATGTLAGELAKQLDGILTEARQPVSQQTHGVPPLQAAFAALALARVEVARGDVVAARRAVRTATDFGVDDVRFAEETIDTLYSMGDLALARTAGEVAMAQYPTSARARIGTALVLLAQGHPNEAIDLLSKQADTMTLADALAARGNAYLAIGDTVAAEADFDAALKKQPTHEPALVGRTWLDLANNDVATATSRIAPRVSPKGSSLGVMVVYAATLRRAGDPASRAQARDILEKVVVGPAGPDQVRAQLELARIYRDDGEFASARAAFDKAARNGGFEPRLEGALLAIDFSKPTQGRDALETLLQEAGERPSPQLIIETVRARLLVGEHALAAELLAVADKMSSVERFKLDREHGRLALRKSDFAGASDALSRALDTCGSDAETFLLAADAAIADAKSGLMEKVKKLAPDRLKGRAELHVVEGKMLIAAEKVNDAEAAYKAASEELAKEKASNRRRAQADFGLAVVAYARQNMAATQAALDVVVEEDPTIVDAYMFAAEIAKDKHKAYAYARKATQFNPDYAYAWLVVGRLAHELKDKRALADAVGRLTVIAPSGDELKELQKLAPKQTPRQRSRRR